MSIHEGSAEAQWSHAFTLKEWSWSLLQSKLLADGVPLCPPVFFPYQAIGFSAIVTVDASMQSAAPEAFVDISDASSGQSVLKEPLVCAVKQHPRLTQCYATLTEVFVAQPGNYHLRVAVRHPSRPQDILRSSHPFQVINFM